MSGPGAPPRAPRIGIFDSGVGGLTVQRAVLARELDRPGVAALFKVWGTGPDNVFAVGDSYNDIAMLGEASHGDGQTEAFKIQLIERLVAQCGYNALLFEASFAEFIPLGRAQRNGVAVDFDQPDGATARRADR